MRPTGCRARLKTNILHLDLGSLGQHRRVTKRRSKYLVGNRSTWASLARCGPVHLDLEPLRVHPSSVCRLARQNGRPQTQLVFGRIAGEVYGSVAPSALCPVTGCRVLLSAYGGPKGRMAMGHSEYDPGVKDQQPWNVGRTIGAKKALKPQQVWAIRFWLDHERRLRDRAMFDLAIDSKLRGCDIVKVKIGDLVSGGRVRARAIVIQQKTGRAGAIRASGICSREHTGLAGASRRCARRLRISKSDRPCRSHQHPSVRAACG